MLEIKGLRDVLVLPWLTTYMPYFAADTSRPKKTGEVNERDYYFVSRAAFEADIATLKFVEHGELGGHYYGTALSSIRRVISSGKYCILNLYCEV